MAPSAAGAIGRRGPARSRPQNVKVDLWPDVSELGPQERFDTAFHHADGSVAQVFSSFRKETVLRHFQWMRDYGIDGAFVQRFAAGARSPEFQRQNNTVLAHCREGANRFGRAYALMYDLSGLREGGIDEVIDDFRELRQRMKLGDDPAYLHHRGKPLVAVWGIGFNDKRAYTLAECRRLIEFLKNDPEVGGCAVMLGVPDLLARADARRRRRSRAARGDRPRRCGQPVDGGPLRHAGAGRPSTPRSSSRPTSPGAPSTGSITCRSSSPASRWHNMYPAGKTNAIPRLRGSFLWSQFQADKRAGARMLYVAMFDEVDEGTAIFKCTNDVPPDSEAPFRHVRRAAVRLLPAAGGAGREDDARGDPGRNAASTTEITVIMEIWHAACDHIFA